MEGIQIPSNFRGNEFLWGGNVKKSRYYPPSFCINTVSQNPIKNLPRRSLSSLPRRYYPPELVISASSISFILLASSLPPSSPPHCRHRRLLTAAIVSTVISQQETSPSVPSKKRKTGNDDGFNKRKTGNDDGFNNAVGLITESLKEISKDLSEGIKFDMKINELSEKIPPEILKMNSLSQLEKFKALTKIRSDPINVQNFWQIGEDDREAWVKYILEG